MNYNTTSNHEDNGWMQTIVTWKPALRYVTLRVGIFSTNYSVILPFEGYRIVLGEGQEKALHVDLISLDTSDFPGCNTDVSSPGIHNAPREGDAGRSFRRVSRVIKICSEPGTKASHLEVIRLQKWGRRYGFRCCFWQGSWEIALHLKPQKLVGGNICCMHSASGLKLKVAHHVESPNSHWLWL